MCWWMIVVVAGRETGGGRCYHFALGLVLLSSFPCLFYAHRFGPQLYVVRFPFSFREDGRTKDGRTDGREGGRKATRGAAAIVVGIVVVIRSPASLRRRTFT